jgi:hypothetical protein
MSLHLRQLERILTVVERTLRKSFPDDYHKRCAYSAFGIYTLLKDADVPAHLVGGDFVAFVMSLDGQRAAVQGFGFGEDQPSHFWVEAEGRLIDIAPHFLPRESSFPVVEMPAVAWNLAEPLPLFLRYRVQDRITGPAAMSADPVINARCDSFVAACQQRLQAQIGPLDFPTWLLTGANSLAKKAQGRDRWAWGAEKFARISQESDLPF